MILIENDVLQARFTAAGAELLSLTDRATGYEYIWQGDPEYWEGHSPILFPITGGLWNGTCRIDGREYRIPKHGFAQRKTFGVEDIHPDSVVFSYVGTEADAEVFPWDFCLRLIFTLKGRSLEARMEVENRTDCTMYFQAGGHPAIALPDFRKGSPADGFLRFEGNATHLLRAGEQGCIEVEGDSPRQFPLPTNADNLVPINEDTFRNEALILNEQISGATVLDLQGRPIARVESTSPVWLFWSPQGKQSPFVCLEPWYGMPDLQHFAGPVADRPYIQTARPHGAWRGIYTVETFAR